MPFIKKYTYAAAFGLLLFSSCKKEVSDPTPEPTPADTTVSAADRIKDTVLDYSREIYLWYNQIPANFNARSYSDPAEIMTAIRQYSTEPGFDKPVDRWSFAMKQAEWNNVSSGIAGDFGLNIFYRTASDLRVRSVEATSPAGIAGIHRGWRITKINGSTNITTSNLDDVVDKVYSSPSTTFTFEKPDGTTADIALNAATYQENPIILDSIYNVGGKKIGYFSFNSFLGNKTQLFSDFDAIFKNFAAQQIGDLIVDLRYNGGGYVDVQEKLAEYLAPASANGDVMMTFQYNDKFSDQNETVRFSKAGSLNLPRLFFIVSKNSASASELLINNLKPYTDVQLVGPSKTYGKPVGFGPIPVADWYIFPVSFRTTNKAGEGSYFDGLALNKQVADGLDKDWGDLQESCLASVVNYITTGAFLGAAGPSAYTQSADVVHSNEALSKPQFKGMITAKGFQ